MSTTACFCGDIRKEKNINNFLMKKSTLSGAYEYWSRHTRSDALNAASVVGLHYLSLIHSPGFSLDCVFVPPAHSEWS